MFPVLMYEYAVAQFSEAILLLLPRRSHQESSQVFRQDRSPKLRIFGQDTRDLFCLSARCNTRL